jgi:hypothetical protein
MPKFQPGKSGNAQGRPRGVPDRRAPLRELIAKQAPELIAVALAQAKAGDTTALGLLLARCVPPLRPASDPISFAMPAGASLADQARAILAGIASGDIDPHTGRALVDAVAAVGRVVELDEIEKRLTALEGVQTDDT